MDTTFNLKKTSHESHLDNFINLVNQKLYHTFDNFK